MQQVRQLQDSFYNQLLNMLILLAVVVCVSTLDVYLVRHGARAPLRTPMLSVFGVALKKLTAEGRMQAYYFGQQLRHRYPHCTHDNVTVHSTNISRTLLSAQYSLKGLFGINKKGLKVFDPNPQFLPPCQMSFAPIKQSHRVSEKEYRKLVTKTPKSAKRVQLKKGKSMYINPSTKKYYTDQISRHPEVCSKFQKFAPGSCKHQTLKEYFGFVDIVQSLRFIHLTVPNLTSYDMRLPLAIRNKSYRIVFHHLKLPTPMMRYQYSLIREAYDNNREGVLLIFTHDKYLFSHLLFMLGEEGLFGILGNNVIMDFLSAFSYRFYKDQVAIMFNDQQLYIKACDKKRCSIQAFWKLTGQS